MKKRITNRQFEDDKTDSHDAQTSKRIHEHLSNKGDVISIEDIQKAKTDLGNKLEYKEKVKQI